MLYFIKGDSPKNWGAMKLKLTKGASPSAVIAGMEKDGWKSVTVSAFNAWRKQNSRPTQRAADVATPQSAEENIYHVEWIDADTIRLTPRR